jgi:hypothetical protein
MHLDIAVVLPRRNLLSQFGLTIWYHALRAEDDKKRRFETLLVARASNGYQPIALSATGQRVSFPS